MINIAIADDHEMFAQGIASFLSESDYFGSIIVAKDGSDLIAKLHAQTIDVILLDIDMPKLNGEDTLEVLQKQWPDIKIIMLTMHDEAAFISKYLNLNVDGYLLKTAKGDELLKAINWVHEGSQYVASELLVKVQKAAQEQKKVDRELELLTEREIEIVKLTTENKSVAEIAEDLFISEHTVKSHRKNILRKLKLSNSLGIARFAFKHGLA